MKIPEKKELITFKEWWEQNKAVYNEVVCIDIARTIWSVGMDAYEHAFIKTMIKQKQNGDK